MNKWCGWLWHHAAAQYSKMSNDYTSDTWCSRRIFFLLLLALPRVISSFIHFSFSFSSLLFLQIFIIIIHKSWPKWWWCCDVPSPCLHIYRPTADRRNYYDLDFRLHFHIQRASICSHSRGTFFFRCWFFFSLLLAVGRCDNEWARASAVVFHPLSAFISHRHPIGINGRMNRSLLACLSIRVKLILLLSACSRRTKRKYWWKIIICR